MDFQISIADMETRFPAGEIDCMISAEPQAPRRRTERRTARHARRAARLEPPGIWLDRQSARPVSTAWRPPESGRLRVGFGGQRPVRRAGSRWRPPPGLGRGPGRGGPAAAELRVISAPTPASSPRSLPARTQSAAARGRSGCATPTSAARTALIGVAADGGLRCQRPGITNGTGLDGVPVGTASGAGAPRASSSTSAVTCSPSPAADAGTSASRCAPTPANPFGLAGQQAVPDRAGAASAGRHRPRRRAGPGAAGSSWLTMLLAPVLSLATGGIIGAVTHQWLFLLLGLGGVAAR